MNRILEWWRQYKKNNSNNVVVKFENYIILLWKEYHLRLNLKILSSDGTYASQRLRALKHIFFQWYEYIYAFSKQNHLSAKRSEEIVEDFLSHLMDRRHEFADVESFKRFIFKLKTEITLEGIHRQMQESLPTATGKDAEIVRDFLSKNTLVLAGKSGLGKSPMKIVP